MLDASVNKRYLPQECGQDGISMQPGFQCEAVIFERGGDKDELDIRCVWSGGAVLDVIVVFRGGEQLLVVRSEEGGHFSNLSRVSNLVKSVQERGTDVGREGTCSKDPVLGKCFQEFESTEQVVWFRVVDGNTALVFETQVECGVVSEISAYAGGIDEDGNVVFLEERCRTDTGEHEDLGCVNGSAAVEH